MTERIYYVRRRIYHRSKTSDPRGDDHLTKYRTRHFQFRYLVFPWRRHIHHTGKFLIGEQPETMDLHPDEILLVPERTLCGVKTGEGCIYTEIITKKENTMNDLVKAKEVLNLKELISYEEGSIANVDIVHNDTMKFVLMAFDEGTGLTPHRAPGNAILTALEGTAVIGYEGIDYTLNAGESFRFEKNGLHSVTAKGRFKMSLLLVLE